MSSEADDKGQIFRDSAVNARGNPAFIDFLSNTIDEDNPINGAKLQKADYVAIFIALIETVFFPLVLLAIVLIGISLFLSLIA